MASIRGPPGYGEHLRTYGVWQAGQQEERLSWAPTKCLESPGGLQMGSCMEASAESISGSGCIPDGC